MTKSSPATRSRPATRPTLTKLAPKQFKPIPAGAPAKELGEYLRAMIREAGVSLDRVAAAGGMAKNTITTTMDGRSKGWASIRHWINAYTKAVGTAPYARQVDDIRQLYQIGRDNHEAALRGIRAAKPTAGTATSPQAAPGDAAVAAAIAAATASGEDRPRLESLLVEVCIPLPRRTPGAGIDPHNQRFLDDDERDANIALRKRAAQHRANRELFRPAPPSPPSPPAGPADPAGPVMRFAGPADRGPWSTVYRSASAPARSRTARLIPVARIPADRPVQQPPDLPLTFSFPPAPQACEPTTGAPAGAGQPIVEPAAGQGPTAEPATTRPTGPAVPPPPPEWAPHPPSNAADCAFCAAELTALVTGEG